MIMFDKVIEIYEKFNVIYKQIKLLSQITNYNMLLHLKSTMKPSC